MNSACAVCNADFTPMVVIESADVIDDTITFKFGQMPCTNWSSHNHNPTKDGGDSHATTNVFFAGAKLVGVGFFYVECVWRCNNGAEAIAMRSARRTYGFTTRGNHHGDRCDKTRFGVLSMSSRMVVSAGADASGDAKLENESDALNSISLLDAQLKRLTPDIVQDLVAYGRPTCQCGCGCRRKPGRHVGCATSRTLIGPTCCLSDDVNIIYTATNKSEHMPTPPRHLRHTSATPPRQKYCCMFKGARPCEGHGFMWKLEDMIPNHTMPCKHLME